MNKGKLTLVASSIGNMEDVSFRMMRYVIESPIILAEDTRVFEKFKNLIKKNYLEELEIRAIEIEKEQIVISYREQVHEKILPYVLNKLKEGVDIALFSDSGMPAISDPGWNLIDDIYKNNFEIDVVPGPSAVNSALILSGLPTDRYSFIGFLPRRKGRAKKLINTFLNDESTLIIYESPYRVKSTLNILKDIEGEFEGDKRIEVACVKEITKKFQNVYRGSIEDVMNKLNKDLKGEWVICVRIFEG